MIIKLVCQVNWILCVVPFLCSSVAYTALQLGYDVFHNKDKVAEFGRHNLKKNNNNKETSALWTLFFVIPFYYMLSCPRLFNYSIRLESVSHSLRLSFCSCLSPCNWTSFMPEIVMHLMWHMMYMDGNSHHTQAASSECELLWIAIMGCKGGLTQQLRNTLLFLICSNTPIHTHTFSAAKKKKTLVTVALSKL